MKPGKILKHAGITAAGVFILLGIPFLTSDYFAALVTGADVIGGASVSIDAPSGDYLVFINSALHKDEDALQYWKSFFSGEEVSFCFEDITCAVADGDTAGIDMAESYQSNLPENQMKLVKEESIMLLSRMANDQFDIVVMSKEFADRYQVQNDYTENMIVIEAGGASE